MCDENYDDFIFSIVLIHAKSNDCRVFVGKIVESDDFKIDLDIIANKFKNFLDINFGGEIC